MRQFLAVSTLAIAVANSAHGGTVNGFETGYYVGVDAGRDQFRGPAFFGNPLAVDEERTTTFNYDGLIDFDQAVDCLLGTCPRAQINSLEGEGVEYAIAAAGAETGLRVAAAFDIPEDLLFNEEVRVTPAVAIARYVDILTVRSRRVDEVRLQFTIDGLFLGPFVGLKFSAQTEPNDTRFVIGDFGDLEEIGGAFSVFSTQTRTEVSVSDPFNRITPDSPFRFDDSVAGPGVAIDTVVTFTFGLDNGETAVPILIDLEAYAYLGTIDFMSTARLTSVEAFFEGELQRDASITGEAAGVLHEGPDLTPVPLPASAWLLSIGLIGMASLRRKARTA